MDIIPSQHTFLKIDFLQPFVLAHESEQRGDTSPYVEDVQVDI